MIGHRLDETPDGKYRFIRPLQIDNGLQYRRLPVPVRQPWRLRIEAIC
jgi:hypothetical protein